MAKNKLENIDSNIANKERVDKIKKALEMAAMGTFDGAHHKMWTIDQMVRILTGSDEEYKEWVKKFQHGNDGPETYFWDIGIAP